VLGSGLSQLPFAWPLAQPTRSTDHVVGLVVSFFARPTWAAGGPFARPLGLHVGPLPDLLGLQKSFPWPAQEFSLLAYLLYLSPQARAFFSKYLLLRRMY
jgi:hypothetical protein